MALLTNEEKKQRVRQRVRVRMEEGTYETFPETIRTDHYQSDKYQRVAIYARVSTDDVSQTTSFELQKKYYEDFVAQHPKWELVGIYADEGISGTSTKKRDAFNRMMADAKAGKIELIITKSVSRFARNVENFLTAVRTLSEHKPRIGVFFESENIFSLKEDSQMALSFQATILNIKSRTSPDVESIVIGRVDLIQLKSLLDYLNDLGVNYNDTLLPSRDIPFGSSKHGYIWSGYSKEQKTKRIAKYLKFVDDSYMQMCEDNFPVLCPYFSRYKDHPCRAIALVDYKENEDESDFFSCPSVTYYFEAAEDNSNCEPIVHEIKDEQIESDSIFHDIQESYAKQGRMVNNMVMHSTSFSSMLTDRRTGENAPLREAVYDEIKTSIEEIFGRLI